MQKRNYWHNIHYSLVHVRHINSNTTIQPKLRTVNRLHCTPCTPWPQKWGDIVPPTPHGCAAHGDNVGGLGEHVKKNMLWFLRYAFFNFFALLFGSRRARTSGPILTIYTLHDVFPPKDVPFGVAFILLPILGVKYPKKTDILGASIGIFKLNAQKY